MKRQSFYISIAGLSEEQIQEELSLFLNGLTKKYGRNKFGATVLGIKDSAAKEVENFLNQ